MNFYKRYTGDYARDTAHLSLMEHGVYALLLDHIYSTEKPIKNPAGFYRVCRAVTEDEKKAVDSVREQFFHETTEGWWNRRAVEEIRKASVMRQAAAANGKRGGRPSISKPRGNPAHNPEGNPEGTQTITQTITETITQNKPSTKANQTPDFLSEGSLRSPSVPKVVSVLPTSKPKPTPVTEPNARGVTCETWDAYAEAYRERYTVDPVRNAKVNAQLAALVKRLGAEEAPKVAAFYLQHNGQRYVLSGHSVDQLLRDAEKLRTEWVSGRRITRAEARSAETVDAVREQARRVDRMLGGSK